MSGSDAELTTVAQDAYQLGYADALLYVAKLLDVDFSPGLADRLRDEALDIELRL